MKDVCSRGHPLEGDNVYFIPKTGVRRCRTCKREVWDKTDRQRTRKRMGLAEPDPHLGRYALPRGCTI